MDESRHSGGDREVLATGRRRVFEGLPLVHVQQSLDKLPAHWSIEAPRPAIASRSPPPVNAQHGADLCRRGPTWVRRRRGLSSAGPRPRPSSRAAAAAAAATAASQSGRRLRRGARRPCPPPPRAAFCRRCAATTPHCAASSGGGRATNAGRGGGTAARTNDDARGDTTRTGDRTTAAIGGPRASGSLRADSSSPGARRSTRRPAVAAGASRAPDVTSGGAPVALPGCSSLGFPRREARGRRGRPADSGRRTRRRGDSSFTPWLDLRQRADKRARSQIELS